MQLRGYIITAGLVFIFVIGCGKGRSEAPAANIETVDYSKIDETHLGTPDPLLDSKLPLEWKMAVFMHLKVGIDTRNSAIKVLGKPTSSGNPDESDPEVEPKILDEYTNFSEIYSSLSVYSSKRFGTIYTIVAVPRDPTIESTLRLYGDEYVRKNYEFFSCPGDTGNAVVVESADGDINYIEYRSKGISIWIRDDKVQEISFLSKPIGVARPKCAK